jgi:hypothetical protein
MRQLITMLMIMSHLIALHDHHLNFNVTGELAKMSSKDITD